ncbi:uncharacterized protein LOC141696494 [Apium graveolens]|uniref:uncharacterized protein LOC141696494 n=1 Tax=Apium graveolens TaxID=4045 RepID=UPI003D7B532B
MIVYYTVGRDEDETKCRICQASRWKLNKKGDVLEGIPAKVLWYFPLIPRLRNFFNSPQTSKDLTWHDRKRLKDGKLRHPADAQTWKEVDARWPDFSSDPRNLRLALSSNVFNLFRSCNHDYSCWPVLMLIYNLPPWLCMKRKYIMLCLLIFGPTQPGNDIDVFLQPLIDDLKKLWHGKQVYDTYKNEQFLLRGILLWTISDYPAYVRGHEASKVVSRHHPYRRKKQDFDYIVEKEIAPVPLTGEEVLERVQHLKGHVYGKTQRQPRLKKGDVRPVWKKVSIFFEIEYWKFFPVRHVLDVMHIEKNICESLLGTMLNIPKKMKDKESVRIDMAEMGIRTELRPKTPGKMEKLPLASWNLTHSEKRAICSKVIEVDKLEKMQSQLVETLCQLEKYFPPSLFDLMFHISVHLVREVELCGPIFLRWMYPFERYMKTFKGYIRNRARAEGCIAEAYIAEEAVECLVDNEEVTIGVAKKGRHTKDSICKPLSGATIITPSCTDLHVAHLCVLQNTITVRPYIDEHMAFLMTKYPKHENDEMWLKNKQNETFPKWFKEKIASNLADEKEISAEIRWITDEPNKDVTTFSGYRMDGVTFSTKDHDDIRQVQCSGVCVEVDTMVVQDINKGIKVDDLGYTSVNLNRLGFLNDPFVLAKHVKQVCYIDDPSEKLWSVLLKLPEKKYHEDYDDADEESVEVELENDCFMPNFPEIDDSGDDMDSYMHDVDELIQLS